MFVARMVFSKPWLTAPHPVAASAGSANGAMARMARSVGRMARPYLPSGMGSTSLVDVPTATLEIPVELRPADGRFGCGPSKVRPEQLEALARDGAAIMGTSHRQAPVRDAVGRIRTGLLDLFAAPHGSEA